MEQLQLLDSASLPNRVRDLTSLSSEEESALIERALELIKGRFTRGELLSSATETKTFLQLHLAERCNELFAVIFLDNRNRVVAFEELFFGSIAGASVHPRVVVQRALHHNAAAVVFAHNHPSGIAEPSEADRAITRRLKDALLLIEVRTLDHFIVGSEGTYSFAENGLL